MSQVCHAPLKCGMQENHFMNIKQGQRLFFCFVFLNCDKPWVIFIIEIKKIYPVLPLKSVPSLLGLSQVQLSMYPVTFSLTALVQLLRLQWYVTVIAQISIC